MMSTDTDAGHVDVVAVRHDGRAPAGPTTVLRLLWLLPPDWTCKPEVAADRVRLRITPGPRTGLTAVHHALSAAFTDTALRGWSHRTLP
ncbi:hypothetical protein [Streptomyces zhihengii]|uniref:hypothetical protein n=1 Tax=Streptomyces zhihengii TaxID=1818004 RepID=UPI0034533E2D